MSDKCDYIEMFKHYKEVFEKTLGAYVVSDSRISGVISGGIGQ